MKAMKHHQATLNKFSEKSFFIKIATKFLLPVSIFSIVVSYSSLISSALQFFNFSVSADSKQLSGRSIDKNFMFLLCNGLLVFIFKNSGVINKSPDETDLNNAKISIRQRDSEQQVVKVSEEKGHMEIEEAQETEQRSCVMVAAENVVSVAQDDQADELMIIDEENEEEEEEGTGLLSTEELNKKCDDFIRKMKEGIKFEQLIMV